MHLRCLSTRACAALMVVRLQEPVLNLCLSTRALSLHLDVSVYKRLVLHLFVSAYKSPVNAVLYLRGAQFTKMLQISICSGSFWNRFVCFGLFRYLTCSKHRNKLKTYFFVSINIPKNNQNRLSLGSFRFNPPNIYCLFPTCRSFQL
jgi:hypothetical protein